MWELIALPHDEPDNMEYIILSYAKTKCSSITMVHVSPIKFIYFDIIYFDMLSNKSVASKKNHWLTWWHTTE